MRGVVLAVLVWPLVHLVLVARYEVDPWELFGWAMYAQPAARVQVRVDVERDGVRSPLRAMGATRQAIRDYARRRTALGRLAPPDALAQSVLESRSEAEAVWIVLRRIELDRRTAHLVGVEREIRFGQR
jgi:hypothetical protein